MKSTLFSILMTVILITASGCNPKTMIEDELKKETKNTLKQMMETKVVSFVEKGVAKKLEQKLDNKKSETQKTLSAAIEKLNRGEYQACRDQLKPLVKRNNPFAEYLTALCFQNPGPGKNERWAEIYMKAAIPGLKTVEMLSGDFNATFYLGCQDLQQGNIEKGQARLKEVFPTILARAINGDGNCQQRIAIMYDYGRGTEQDKSKAIGWYKKCASKGYVYANYKLGYFYLSGKEVVERNFTTAKKYLQNAVDKNYAPAQTELGWHLHHSKSAKDRKRGLQLLVLASLQGESSAAKLLDKIANPSNTVAKPSIRKGTTSKTKAPQTQAEVKSFAKKVSRVVGKKIMDSIGGGQDLVVSVKAVDFDSIMGQYEIDIVVSFNGVVFRSDNYRVAGRITVNKDGTGARFAKTASNENFKQWENILTAIVITDVVLEALND